jgi:hypothetical protein
MMPMVGAKYVSFLFAVAAKKRAKGYYDMEGNLI